MDKLKKILAKGFVWVIIALLCAFPLALIPLTIVESLVDNYEVFLTNIKGQVRVLYLLFALLCFVGILFIRFVSQAITVLFEN